MIARSAALVMYAFSNLYWSTLASRGTFDVRKSSKLIELFRFRGAKYLVGDKL